MLRRILPTIASLAVVLALPAEAQQSCVFGTRVPFAGHSLPLDGDLTDDSFSVVPAFPNLPGFALSDPIFLAHAGDGSNRLFAVQQGGLIKVFRNDPTITDADVTTFLDVSTLLDTSAQEEGLLGLAFHPDYASNGYLYVYYTSTSCSASAANRCARVARYRVDAADPKLADPTSAWVVLEIDRPGTGEEHNAGMLAFGDDGYLYISVGDGGTSSLAADVNSLRGKILRIDVDGGSEFSPGIPPDNPFGNAVWHLGLRNRWRFSFDRELAGDLWIADVGASMWEEVNYVPAGSGGGLDFGWPGCAGTHPQLDPVCDPASSLPDIEYAQTGSRKAVVGGYVYRGPVASLTGKYVYADLDGEVFAWDRSTRDPNPPNLAIPELLAPSSGDRRVSFGEDEAGELYVLQFSGSRINRLATASSAPGDPFPEWLSQTGLFADTAALTPAPGLLEYDVASPLWSDGALKQRWIALPGVEPIRFEPDGGWDFPVGTALVKHFALDTGSGVKRLETRVMLRQNGRWLGLTYRWNAAQDDAQLLRDEQQEVIPLAGGGSLTWTYPSPGACLGCHSAPGGRVLGPRTRQLNASHAYPGGVANQLEALDCIGVFDTTIGDASQFVASAPLGDATVTRQHRVRSYLASNCAHCHQPGTGVANIDLRPDILLAEMNAIGHAPARGDLGLASPQIIEAGNHANSVLWLRMDSSDDTIRMAAGTRIPHPPAVAEVRDWIDAELFDIQAGTARLDSDEDGALDAVDTCPSVPDPQQLDADGDGLGDACDPDLLPDLSATPTGPTIAGLGDLVTLRADVFNVGASAAGSSQVRFYLSPDPALDAGDRLVGDCFAGPTPGAGASSCSDATVTVPADLGGVGAYYWLSCADAFSLVLEADESNNCFDAPVRLVANSTPRIPALSAPGHALLVLLLIGFASLGWPRPSASIRRRRAAGRLRA